LHGKRQIFEIMTRFLRYFVLLVIILFAADTVIGQTTDIRGLHQVKRKETIFGIAKLYEISIQQLIDANPEMKNPGYELKKGDVLRIPWAKSHQQEGTVPAVQANPQPSAPVAQSVKANDDVRHRTIRVGVMLPLHDINGDGRRMVEYYRGILMACDSLKKLGISVDVHAWNTAENSD
jgi:hypothetical protein